MQIRKFCLHNPHARIIILFAERPSRAELLAESTRLAQLKQLFRVVLQSESEQSLTPVVSRLIAGQCGCAGGERCACADGEGGSGVEVDREAEQQHHLCHFQHQQSHAHCCLLALDARTGSTRVNHCSLHTNKSYVPKYIIIYYVRVLTYCMSFVIIFGARIRID